MNTSIAQTAVEMTADWRANDGGLTHAAGDLVWLAGGLDKALASVDSTGSAMTLMEELVEALWGADTGTESGLYSMAMDSLRSSPFYQEGVRQQNLAKLRQEALARRHWLPQTQ